MRVLNVRSGEVTNPTIQIICAQSVLTNGVVGGSHYLSFFQTSLSCLQLGAKSMAEKEARNSPKIKRIKKVKNN